MYITNKQVSNKEYFSKVFSSSRYEGSVPTANRLVIYSLTKYRNTRDEYAVRFIFTPLQELNKAVDSIKIEVRNTDESICFVCRVAGRCSAAC